MDIPEGGVWGVKRYLITQVKFATNAVPYWFISILFSIALESSLFFFYSVDKM